MKKLLLLALALLLALPAASGEEVADLIKGQGDAPALSGDAPLLEVYFPKINGVDAAFVRCGEYSMLIDCGGNEWRDVKAMLDRLGVREITYALNSHPDADHIGGFNQILPDIPAGEFLLGFPEDYPEGDAVRYKVYADLHTLGIPFRTVGEGDTIEFGDVQIAVHQRTDDSLVRVNNKSVILLISLGERRILFTGDIQRDAQLLLAAEDSLDLKADIMKAPHHGYNRIQEAFFAKVDPQMVIITSGRNGAGVKEQLDEKDVPYYFCQDGILRLATDGTVWTVERIK